MLNHIFQTKVSLNRILGFLDIGEVADDVYTPSRPVIKDPQELIIENAHFKWSTAIKKTESDQNTSKPSSHTPLPSESTVVGDADSEAAISASTRTAVGGPDATFELRNITVKPEPGKLTVILTFFTITWRLLTFIHPLASRSLPDLLHPARPLCW